MQPSDSAEMEAETIIIHSYPYRGAGPHCAVLGMHIKLKKKTPKNSSTECKDGQNWQGEEEGRRTGRVPASCLTVLQCLLCWEAGEGQVGTKDCEGTVLWPEEEVQTAKILNCIWNSLHTLSNSVFIAWLDTGSLLLVIARQWLCEPPLFPHTAFALQQWMGYYLPFSTPHSQKLS